MPSSLSPLIFPSIRDFSNELAVEYAVEVMNRFKGLDLVDIVPEELWMKVQNIVQEAMTKTIPKKKKCKKAKWLSEEALQIAEKIKRSKRCGKKGKIHQTECRVPEKSKEKKKKKKKKERKKKKARRDEKAFLNEQCKEIEENNIMGKTRDLFKKTGDIKGKFHVKMGTIKDKNRKDLTEAEEIRKRWQEYTEELYKKSLDDLDNHDGVVTHLEPDILECEIKWALGSITVNKASGSDEIPAELFQILKNDAVEVLHSIYQQIWKTQQWPQDWKRSIFISIPKKGNVKEC